VRQLARAGWAFAAALVIMALAVSLVGATDFLGGKLRSGDTVTVPAGETVDHDLYVFAGTATIDATVNGDVVTSGGTVRITGPVHGDVLVAGGTVDVTGPVDGDVRAAAGTLTISGNVTEDVLAAGGTYTQSGTVGQDLMFATGQAVVSGNVTGSILGSAGQYTRSGNVGGSEQVSINQGRQVVRQTATNAVLDAIRQLVVVLIFGLLMLWLFPRATRAAEGELRQRTLLSFASGFLACLGYIALLIVGIVLMILLAIVFGVLTLGALAAIEVFATIVALLGISILFWVAVAFLADVVVSLLLGRLLAPRMGMQASASRWQDVWTLAIGAVIIVVVTSLPIIGGLAKFVVVLAGLGALALAGWAAWRRSSTPSGPSQAGMVAPTAPPGAGAAN
jgi:hypothetical protein